MFRANDELEIVPAAAADWTVNREGTLYRFVIRRNERFHDGSPVVADDFVRAWNRIVNGTPGELSPNAHLLREVFGYEDSRSTSTPLTGVRAVDRRTLEVELSAPNFSLPEVLTHPSLAPVPADVEDGRFRASPIGNGPFKMAQPWEHGRFIRVVRNDDYAGSRPWLDEVVFQIYGDEADSDAYRDFEEGQLHYAVVPPDELEQARALHGRSPDGYSGPGVIDGENLILYYLGFNVQAPPFDDPDVRRALSMAIDRTTIAEELLDGTRVPADRLVPSGIPGSTPDTCPYCVHDPEAARALLEGRELEPIALAFNAHPAQEAIARAVRQDIEESLGIKVNLSPREFDEYLPQLRAGEVAFFRLGWEAEYPSADNYLEPLFGSANVGDTNVVRLADPDIDQLIAQARGTADEQRRRELYLETERRVLGLAPLAPVMFYRHNRIVDDVVRDLRVRADGSVDLTRVWLADGA
ncbi:MAG: peptide ABC transporter substrate-binding protein [Actinobacteria bacterium]|nr:peptide ABC transporter substrate-binding protein [Actinomycetota bacterium]